MTAALAIIGGGIFLLLGLLLAFGAMFYNAKVMGEAALGVGVYAPSKDSPEWRQKVRLRKISDWMFYLGVFFSLLGVCLQTYGSVAK
jgi:hypothetical protein